MKRPIVVNRKFDAYDIYIGRPSIWGNPFEVVAGSSITSRTKAIEAYRTWIATQPDLLGKLHTLAGKRIACWCKPKACHGDVLADLVEKLNV